MPYRSLTSYSIPRFTLFVLLCLTANSAFAQSTAFTYQGKLSDGGNLANATYDMQFKLFDAATNGNQIGATLTFDGSGTNPPAVSVTSGLFAVTLDFGTCPPPFPCFNGSPRFLEIAVKPHGSGSYTTLTPRQPITATPYAMKTANLTFNGAYNDGTTIFTASNTFAGDGAGLNTTPDPILNSANGKLNAFFGAGAGQANTTGIFNAFFGAQAGLSNTTGERNIFLGIAAGFNNTTGSHNTFIGYSANFNVSNPTGDDNTLLGYNTRVFSGVSNGTAIGANVLVTQSDSLVLGHNANVGIGTNAPARLLHLLGEGSNGLGIGDLLITGNGTVGAALTLESSFFNGRKYSWISTNSGASSGAGKLAAFDATAGAYRLVIESNGEVGIGTTSPADKLHVAGDVRVGTGTTGCVRDGDGSVIAGTCSSDARFKRDIVPFAHLLDKVAQLQAVHFYWRADEFKDRHFGTKLSYGLIAQEVEKVLPELVSTDEQGYKAVNYSKLPLLTLQAVKELKAENDQLKKENEALRQHQQSLEMRVKALTQLVCKTASNAEICKP